MAADTTIHPPLIVQRRKRNFTDAEASIIIQYIVNHYDTLHNLPGYNLSAETRQAMWQELVDMVNAQGVQLRTITDIKKRWQDEKRRVRAKMQRIHLAAMLPAGANGSPEMLNPNEQFVADIIQSQNSHGYRGHDTDATQSDVSFDAPLLERSVNSDGHPASRRKNRHVMQDFICHQDDSREDETNASLGSNNLMSGSSSQPSGIRRKHSPQMDLSEGTPSPPIVQVLVETKQEPEETSSFAPDADNNTSPSHSSHVITPDGSQVAAAPYSIVHNPVAHRRRGLPRKREGVSQERGEFWEQDFFMQQDTVQDTVQDPLQETLNSMEGRMSTLAHNMGSMIECMSAQASEMSNLAGAVHLGQEDLLTLLVQQHRERTAQHEEVMGMYRQSLAVFGRIATAVERYVDMASSTPGTTSARTRTTSPPHNVGVQEVQTVTQNAVPPRGRASRRHGLPHHSSSTN